MKEGEKLRTNEARVKKHGQRGTLAKTGVFPKCCIFKYCFCKKPSSRAAIWYLQTSVSPLSGDSKPLLTQIRQQLQEQGRKRKRESYRRKGKMLQFFAQDTVEGNGSFFPTLQKTPKQNGRTHSARTTSDGRRQLGDRGRKHLDQELSNQVPKANQQLWAQGSSSGQQDVFQLPRLDMHVRSQKASPGPCGVQAGWSMCAGLEEGGSHTDRGPGHQRV